MNNLLIFFAFPIAVIIVSIILQKLLYNPGLVAALVFAVFLIITFTASDETFLIATLAYTVLAFVTAVITRIFCNCNNGEESDICNLLSSNAINQDESQNNCQRTASINNQADRCGYTYNRYKKF